MSFHFTPGDPCIPGDPCRVSKFFLDPLAFESFDLTLQTDLTLPGDGPPLLIPNTNVVPEPQQLLLLAILTAVLVVSHRRVTYKRRNER